MSRPNWTLTLAAAAGENGVLGDLDVVGGGEGAGGDDVDGDGGGVDRVGHAGGLDAGGEALSASRSSVVAGSVDGAGGGGGAGDGPGDAGRIARCGKKGMDWPVAIAAVAGVIEMVRGCKGGGAW